MTGAAVYIWHCDQDGAYSMYGQGITRRELPARRPGDGRQRQGDVHEHLPGRVLRSLAAHPLRGVPEPGDGDERREQDRGRRSSRSRQDVCNAVYATDGYSQSVRNLAQTSLQTDKVFSDGVSLQTPTITGNTSGYTAKNLVGV